jgi:hypothetical protein
MREPFEGLAPRHLQVQGLKLRDRLDELENRLRSLLLDFESQSGREIESVRVDTRNFANLAVEVFVKDRRGL